MATFERHEPNSISWVDLAASDLDAQVDFYTGLFGWGTHVDEASDYRILLNGDAPVGGAMAMSPEMGAMPTVWSVYVAVEDADATLARAVELGGSVAQPPFEIPDGGRIAVMLDPAQAALCLFEGGMSSGLGQLDEVGAPCWFDCRSRDAAASVAFYEQLFGWTSEPMADAGPVSYTVLSKDGVPNCGVMQMVDEMFPPMVPSHWALTFSVADADATVAAATEAGGQVLGPVMDTPFGRTANLVDPQGAGFMVIDRSSATDG